MHFTAVFTLLATVAAEVVDASPAPVIEERSSVEPYQPYAVPCPTGSIIRPATSLNCDEAAYISKRRPLADEALQQWLHKTWGSMVPLDSCELPTMALALSGGGPKAGLLSAGVVQALDSRDSSTGVSGLLQSMTYWSALSGGSITLEGVIGNNFEKISTLRTTLYNTNYQDPVKLVVANRKQIGADLVSTAKAGLPVTLVDLYGRLFGYNFIGGSEGANGKTWSAVASMPAFTSAALPFPVTTTTSAFLSEGQCLPASNGTIWEFSPYEFGAWNRGVGAFIPTKYLGTKVVAGKSARPGQCITDFDNQGFITGMSSNILAKNASHCEAGAPIKPSSRMQAEFFKILKSAIPQLNLTTSSLYGIVPNPFYKYPASTSVSMDTNLFMTDGGDSGQPIPLLPWVQPQRTVDVIIAVDMSSKSSHNTTTGSSLYATYLDAQRFGLTRMPRVPTTTQIAAQNLASHARFFGCNQKDAATLVWLPNSNTSAYASKTFFNPPANINNLIHLGREMATQNADPQWPSCLACAVIKKKMSNLPASCADCFNRYCWS